MTKLGLSLFLGDTEHAPVVIDDASPMEVLMEMSFEALHEHAAEAGIEQDALTLISDINHAVSSLVLLDVDEVSDELKELVGQSLPEGVETSVEGIVDWLKGLWTKFVQWCDKLDAFVIKLIAKSEKYAEQMAKVRKIVSEGTMYIDEGKRARIITQKETADLVKGAGILNGVLQKTGSGLPADFEKAIGAVFHELKKNKIKKLPTFPRSTLMRVKDSGWTQASYTKLLNGGAFDIISKGPVDLKKFRESSKKFEGSIEKLFTTWKKEKDKEARKKANEEFATALSQLILIKDSIKLYEHLCSIIVLSFIKFEMAIDWEL